MIKTHEEARTTLRELVLTATTTYRLMKIAELLGDMKINGAISISQTETVCYFDYMRVNDETDSIEFIVTPNGEADTSCYAICYTLNILDVENISTDLFDGMCEITVSLSGNETVIIILSAL